MVSEGNAVCFDQGPLDLTPFRQNLEVWMEAKKEIDKIEPHPNQAPAEVLESLPNATAGPSQPNGIH